MNEDPYKSAIFIRVHLAFTDCLSYGFLQSMTKAEMLGHAAKQNNESAMFECHIRAMLRLTVCSIAGQIVPEVSRSILLDYQDRNPKSVIEIVPKGKQGCHVQVDLTSHTSHDHQAAPLIDASPADRGPTSQTTSLLVSSKKGNPSIPVSPTRQYLNP